MKTRHEERRTALADRRREDRSFWDAAATAAIAAMANTPGKHMINDRKVSDVADIGVLVAAVADAALSQRRKRFRPR